MKQRKSEKVERQKLNQLFSDFVLFLFCLCCRCNRNASLEESEMRELKNDNNCFSCGSGRDSLVMCDGCEENFFLNVPDGDRPSPRPMTRAQAYSRAFDLWNKSLQTEAHGGNSHLSKWEDQNRIKREISQLEKDYVFEFWREFSKRQKQEANDPMNFIGGIKKDSPLKGSAGFKDYAARGNGYFRYMRREGAPLNIADVKPREFNGFSTTEDRPFTSSPLGAMQHLPWTTYHKHKGQQEIESEDIAMTPGEAERFIKALVKEFHATGDWDVNKLHLAQRYAKKYGFELPTFRSEVSREKAEKILGARAHPSGVQRPKSNMNLEPRHDLDR
jgi:hypothetical protein